MKVRTHRASGREGKSLSTQRCGIARTLQVAAVLLVPAAPAGVRLGADAPALGVRADTPPVACLRADTVGWFVEWRGCAPFEILVPAFAARGQSAVWVLGEAVCADARGVARAPLDRQALAAAGPVQVRLLGPLSGDVASQVGSTGSGSSSGGGRHGVLTVWPPYAIGGWLVSAPNASYELDDCQCYLGAAVDEEGTLADTLWVAITDESSSGVTAVDVADFAPGSFAAGYDNLVAQVEHGLASGHTLCIRVFDHEPAQNEFASGGLLWDSN